MTRILPNGRRPRGRWFSLWLGPALLLVPGLVPAATDQELPDGLPAGPVFFTPWFQTEVFAEDNIFRRAELQNPAADVATGVRGGVTALIPIRMSNLEIGYEGSTFFYRDTDFANGDTHAGSVVFDLNFSSYNTLRIEEAFTSGATAASVPTSPSASKFSNGKLASRSCAAARAANPSNSGSTVAKSFAWEGVMDSIAAQSTAPSRPKPRIPPQSPHALGVLDRSVNVSPEVCRAVTTHSPQRTPKSWRWRPAPRRRRRQPRRTRLGRRPR